MTILHIGFHSTKMLLYWNHDKMISIILNLYNSDQYILKFSTVYEIILLFSFTPARCSITFKIWMPFNRILLCYFMGSVKTVDKHISIRKHLFDGIQQFHALCSNLGNDYRHFENYYAIEHCITRHSGIMRAALMLPDTIPPRAVQGVPWFASMLNHVYSAYAISRYLLVSRLLMIWGCCRMPALMRSWSRVTLLRARSPGKIII